MNLMDYANAINVRILLAYDGLVSGNRWVATLENAHYVDNADGTMLSGMAVHGGTPHGALKNLAKQLSGKKIVIDFKTKPRNFIVPSLEHLGND